MAASKDLVSSTDILLRGERLPSRYNMLTGSYDMLTARYKMLTGSYKMLIAA